MNPCYLTEIEFRLLHHRFDHFFVRRFEMIFDRIDHDFDIRVFRHLIKYCDQCQKHDHAFDWFSFIIKNDADFNFNVIVNILCITSKPVLHVIDKAIRFQTSRWLKNISAKHLWDQFRSVTSLVWVGRTYYKSNRLNSGILGLLKPMFLVLFFESIRSIRCSQCSISKTSEASNKYENTWAIYIEARNLLWTSCSIQ